MGQGVIKSIRVCYLFMLPYEGTARGAIRQVNRKAKGAPYFYDLGIKFSPLGKVTNKVAKVEVETEIEIMDETVWVAENRYRLTNPLAKGAAERNEAIQKEIKRDLAKIHKVKGDLYEEYTILLIEGLGKKPDGFLKKNKIHLTKLIKSLAKPLDRRRTKGLLHRMVSYSSSEITVVDWDGAVIIADDDFESDIDLMKVGNYQLLRYRMMDRDLEESLDKIALLLAGSKTSWLPKKNDLLHKMVNQRLLLITGFEKVSQSLLLIGDWYTADLYRALVEELYLDQWRKIVNKKLDSLGEIYNVITANLTFHWGRVFDLLDLVGWFILLVGYFVLFFVDIKQAI